MANWNQINNSFAARLQDNWAETPIAWDNVNYTPAGTEWIRATLLPTTTQNAALGTATKNFGIYWIQIFVALQQGSGRAYELAAMLEPLFSNIEFDEVVCYASDVSRTGDEGNGWFQLNFRANFWSFTRI